ncbi:MAG TPA: hypothetical protein VMK66_04140 [Myxococcales bacterium]|nr:hypothetical protein [Myxococcales bacterium]
MLRANHAVRLGLRASSRNPELAFLKALLDQAGNLLALLPLLLAALLLAAVALRGALLPAALRTLRAALALRWPLLGGVLAALGILFLASTLFWAGTVPLLAADTELDQRPPRGNFVLLLSRGAARTLLASLLGWGLALGFSSACTLALLAALPAMLARPSLALALGASLIGTALILGSVLLDALARLTVIRAAAFADPPPAAFGKAVSLLGARLGACVAVTLAFLLLELIAGAVVAALTGFVSGVSFFDPGAELLAIAPRVAIGLAAAAVFSWLEVGHMGALAALAADAEGLIGTPEPPQPPVAELVIEALPVEE